MSARLSPAVTRPLNRAIASAISAVSCAVAVVRFASEAVETWLEERGEVYDARADIDDPDLIDDLEEDE